MNRRVIIGLILASALGAFFAWLELRPTDETLISDLVERLVADVEKRDVGAMAPEISDKYKDERGFGRDGLLAALDGYLKTQSWKKVLPVRLTVSRIEGDRAEAAAKVILADAGGSTHHRRARDAVEVDLTLARESGRWKVTSAEEWEVPTEDAAVAP
jgi:hypothetical protein